MDIFVACFIGYTLPIGIFVTISIFQKIHEMIVGPDTL